MVFFAALRGTSGCCAQFNEWYQGKNTAEENSFEAADPSDAATRGYSRRFNVGINEFKAAYQITIRDEQLLADLVVRHMKESFRSLQGKALVVDESMLPCVKRGAYTVFIPRKPSPRGFRYYLICLRLERSSRSVCCFLLPDTLRFRKKRSDRERLPKAAAARHV